MCQMIVFWYTCSHFILSTMKCPFDGATTHDEETTTVSIVDYPCWLCKQGPDHPQWERIERMRSGILTVDHLEAILDVSPYDTDFLARVAGFYARGDHKRWGQPGESKAKYSRTDSYITSLELEIALAARGERAFPMNAGLMFDLEFALGKRFDLTNVATLFWPLRGWREPCSAFYSSSTMLNYLPSGTRATMATKMRDEKVDKGSPFGPPFGTSDSLLSQLSDTPPSATSLSLCQTTNTWTTSFPDTALATPAPEYPPDSCDNVSTWMQWQDNSDMPVNEASGPCIPDQRFGFDAFSLNSAAMPDHCLPAVQIVQPLMPETDIVVQPPIAPYPMLATETMVNDTGSLYPAGNPILTATATANEADLLFYPAEIPIPNIDTSLPVPAAHEMLPFECTTPVLNPRPTSSGASASMSPMSQCCQTELQQQQQQDMIQNPFGYGSSHQFLSASIPRLHATQAQTYSYQAQAQAQAPPSSLPPQQQYQQQQYLQIPSPLPTANPIKLPRSTSDLFSSHGPPNERYLTPAPMHPGDPDAIPIYQTPDGASEQAYSTMMDTDSSSPSPSMRRGAGARAGARTTARNKRQYEDREQGLGKGKAPMRNLAEIYGPVSVSVSGPVSSCAVGGGVDVGIGITNSSSQMPVPVSVSGHVPDPGPFPDFDSVPLMMTPQPTANAIQGKRSPMTQSTSNKNPASSGSRKRKRDRSRSQSQSFSQGEYYGPGPGPGPENREGV